MRISAVVLVVAAALALAACGSSKPAYCSAQKNLKSSVSGVSNVSSPSELKSSLQKIQSDAKSLSSSAKSDFPSQTAAIQSSLKTLESTLKQAAGGDTAAIKKLPGQVSAAVTSIDDFAKATKSKCS